MIKNKFQLIGNGKNESLKNARKLALESLECAVDSVNPKTIVKRQVSIVESYLKVGDDSYNLDLFEHIFIIGGGKAGGPMAEALEEILGSKITKGIVNVPHDSHYETKIVELHGASHPLPDAASVEGTKLILDIAEKAGESDLIICLISGGGSSLMCYPREGITLAEKKELNNALIKSGASIQEINSVRKHLSNFKGGWLAKRAYPTTVVNIILSDVVGDPLDTIASGPTVPDETTFADARSVLEKYDLWTNLSPSIKQILIDGEKGLIKETPKVNDKAFGKVHNFIIGNNRTASTAALDYLRSKGLNTVLLTCTLEGEAKFAGSLLGSIANELLVSGNPVPKPAAIVVGGETTVKVLGDGLGGRNQELALAAALSISRDPKSNVVIASLGTDGVDGPTDAAGAILDVNTYSKASELGIRPETFLLKNDSYHFFSELRDLIFTGKTGTNVNDISLIVVL
jgi:glycerate 2-kinase